MFRFKRTLSFFSLVLALSLFNFPLIATAHQSNVCPVHTHTSQTYGTCSSLWSGESWYDPMTGCWHHVRCYLGIRVEDRACPDGVQDTCDACGVGTDACDGHLADHYNGCSGNNKPHSWYTCQYNSCPYDS